MEVEVEVVVVNNPYKREILSEYRWVLEKSGISSYTITITKTFKPFLYLYKILFLNKDL